MTDDNLLDIEAILRRTDEKVPRETREDIYALVEEIRNLRDARVWVKVYTDPERPPIEEIEEPDSEITTLMPWHPLTIVEVESKTIKMRFESTTWNIAGFAPWVNV